MRRNQVFTCWSETWLSAETWLTSIEQNLIHSNIRVKKGDVFDRWDLQLRNGIVSVNRALLTIEEHGAGKQNVRLKTWCKPSRTSLTLFTASASLSIIAGYHNAVFASLMLAILSFVIAVEFILDTAILRQKLQTAFKKAVPEVQKLQPTDPPLGIQEASLFIESMVHKETRYSKALKNRETRRVQLIQTENEILTTDDTQ